MFKLLGDVGFQVQFMPMGSFFIFAALPDTCKLMDVCEIIHSIILYYSIK